MDMGPDHPDYMDVVLAANAPDPVELYTTSTMAENIEYPGLGQIDAPYNVVWNVVDNGNLLIWMMSGMNTSRMVLRLMRDSFSHEKSLSCLIDVDAGFRLEKDICAHL